MIRARRAALALALLWSGCGEAPAGDGAPPAAAPAGGGAAVVARVGGEPIDADDLDAPLRLRLYELDEARHRLRRERLLALVAERISGGPVPAGAAEALVAAAVASGEAEMRLEPPPRPRLPVAPGDAPVRGAADAPVAVVVFCDFESIHCRRLQPTLRALRELYGERLAIAHRDHPLPVHRGARAAAEAARCAREQGEDAFWRYHDALYLFRDDLARERFVRIAASLELDAERFADCLDRGRGARAVALDAQLAVRLGLRNVPVSFVNGLYLRGPADVAAFRALIDPELVALGHAPPPPPAADAFPRTRLPIALGGTTLHGDPRRSTAAIESEAWRATRLFHRGDEVMDGTVLLAIERRRVLLRRPDGGVEVLPLRSAVADGGAPLPPLRREGEGEAPVGGVLRLSRESVDRALEGSEELERGLAPGRLDLEGRRLMVLGDVEPGSFYDALGLRSGDVIVQVDDRLVLDDHAALWEALRTQGSVTLTVVRRGLPRRLELEIE